MERYGVREISDVVLKEIGTGKPSLYLETLKVSTNEITADTVHARGGSGNPKRVSWDSNKEVMFNMEDALITAESLAMLSGRVLESGSKSAHKKEVVVLTGGAGATPVTATLEKEPNSSPMFLFKTIRGYDIGDELVINEDYEIDGKVITFLTGDANDLVIVDYYYDSPINTKTIKITDGDFPGYYTLEASTLYRREYDGVDVPALYTMPKIKIQPGFTITGAAEGDPSVFSFNLESYPDMNGEIEIIDILEDE